MSCHNSLPLLAFPEPNTESGQLEERNPKTFGARFIVDGIKPISALMPSSVGLEAMNSIKPELNWKTVTKGRRTRKSVARNLNGVAKAGNTTSPKRVGDFSGSDSDKIGEVVLGQSPSGISEHVPVKKLRRLRQSPSPHLWTPPLHRQDSASPQTRSSLLFEDQKQLLCSDGQRSSDRQINGIQENAKARCGGEGFRNLFPGEQTKRDSGDFSGIELLAAAASMDYDDDSTNKQNLVAEDSVMPKHPDANDSASLSEAGLKCNEPENPSSDGMTLNGSNTNCSPVLSNSAAASQSLCGSSEDGTMPKVSRQYWDLNTLMDAWVEPCDDMKMEERHNACSDHVLSDPVRTEDKYSNLKIEENKLTTVEGMNTYNQVMITDSKLSRSSGLLIPEEKFKYTDIGAKILNEDCSSDISDQYKDNKDSKRTSEPPGTFIQDVRLTLAVDSGIQNDGNCLSGSTISDSQGHLLVAKHEDTNLANESTMNGTEDSSKSCSDGVPTGSVGKIGLATEGPHNSDVSRNNHANMVGGDDLTGFQAGYDSPYEDGELRGSFFYSWEENEMENECVDYESDGRNGDGSDDADYYPRPDSVEGGSEGSHGLLVKGFSGGNSKGEPAKREIAGKGSKAGSGTTGEQSMGMLIDENEDYTRRSQLTDRRDAFDGKLRQMGGGYASKTARGRPRSRIQGRSSIGATDGKDGFFIQQCRSRRIGSYPRSERDFSPDKYPGRYNSRPNTHGERDGNNQWGSRRRYNNTSSYQGADGRIYTRPRNKTGDPSDKMGGLDFHDPPPRQTGKYFPKGLNRPFMRRSPVERDDHFVPGRRMPPTRGGGNYRGRGHYSQRGGRDFRDDDFEPLPDDAGPPARIPRYVSNVNRDRSFSPGFCRNPNMVAPLPRRRSRSRSRTHSPRLWYNHPHREERAFGNNNRRNNRSRSPDFRPEARMERTRMMPFPKPDCRDGGYASPPRNGRWVDDRSNFGEDNYVRRRRSPVRVFKHGQRFDSKTDECFRPAMRRPPGRFSVMANGGRERKLEMNYDDRRRCEDGRGDIGRYRRRDAVVDDFEKSDLNDNTSNSNNKKNEVDVPKEVAESKGDVMEDKGAALEVV
ncbi:hypothetical protein PHJA_002727500 [Phtheirospermum japonicum]|uniref:Uncharacterized protein n=1 Tax=Phtheirospermum japonicum TaxID=374723 RepID=A0A830DCR5_9LAMI|nr:hypothetical protein PHJA_002727500 [Phtheirospermum japonicum]